MHDDRSDITEVLRRIREGDASAQDELWPLVYDGLKQRAAAQLRRERADHTLQPTALVHDAFMKMNPAGMEFNDRRHFYNTAAKAMRRLLVESARRYRRRKGKLPHVPLDQANPTAGGDYNGRDLEIMALNRSFERLQNMDARCGEVVRLRHFAGLSVEETANVMGTSESTVKREWLVGRAWLARDIADCLADVDSIDDIDDGLDDPAPDSPA